MAIMYVCASCYDGDCEICGWTDRTALRVIPDGPHKDEWWCENCYYGCGEFDRDLYPRWHLLPPPREYVPAPDPTSSDPLIEDPTR